MIDFDPFALTLGQVLSLLVGDSHLLHLKLGELDVLLIEDQLEGALIILVVTLDQVIDSLLDYSWVLLLEACCDDFGGFAVLVDQVVTDDGELFGHILNMVEHRLTIKLLSTNLHNNRTNNSRHKVSRIDHEVTHDLLRNHSLGSSNDAQLEK